MNNLLRRTAMPGAGSRRLGVMTLNASAVTVPEDFVGLHLHRYPVNPNPADTSPDNNFGNPDLVPPFSYGGYRTVDGCPFWRDVETSLNNYNWDLTDEFIDYQAGVGRGIIYTMYGTPTWAAPVELQEVEDPYHVGGGAAPPVDNDVPANFITALLEKYNTSGRTREIQYLELWNEPDFNESPSSDSRWWGTAAELVTMNVAMVEAALAVDPAIKILSPGCFNVPEILAKWLRTPDPVSGKTGLDLIDGVAIHPYGTSYYGARSFIDGRPGGCTVKEAKAAIVAAGGSASMPVYVTEYGISGAKTDQPVVDFLASSARNRRAFCARMLAVAAARGVPFFGIYSYNSKLFGDLLNDTDGAIAGVAEVHAALAGSTIVAGGATINQYGRVSVRLSTGATYSW